MLPTYRTKFAFNINTLANQSSQFRTPQAHSDPKRNERREDADIECGFRQRRIREH
jgi:hypothetical protein